MEMIKQLGVRGLNHLLRSEHWALERLVRHAGRQLRIDAGLVDIRLGIDAQGLFVLNEHQGEPDVTLTLPSDILVRALVDRSKLFSSVKLGGSVDVAETLAFVFRNLKWDAEADLAAIRGLESQREAWAARHGLHLRRSAWGGLYSPGNAVMELISDSADGVSLDTIVVALESLPDPLVSSAWPGESAP